MKIESINLNDLMLRLSKADKKLTPKLVNKIDGSSYYSYIKRPGESDINLKEIKKRISLGSDFYKNDRKKILTLLKRINELKINNKLANIGNETLGLWVPIQDLIMINYRTINMGSPTFLNVLRHEVIHVSQSCNSGNRGDFPKRIGLPLEFSKNINLNLHNFYSQNPEELINIEREAFTYSKIDGAAIKLLNKFCK
ncbi:hypothetical protein [Prochlorococcus marinus]|uniref:Uncharacterized protein n=1 Tax=Prochlorococcus marinus str. GP2 TaxID=59925 RepID=A0A0A1ZGJ2_PROMR|nr:hypothetical protein [Prochlorococcus marinus]KGF87646.1 hypothetical protein EU91_0678 [Prochlorococcus marinus str. GP2]